MHCRMHCIECTYIHVCSCSKLNNHNAVKIYLIIHYISVFSILHSYIHILIYVYNIYENIILLILMYCHLTNHMIVYAVKH